MIYVVTQGTYSCYRVIAATTNRKLANKIAKKFSDDCDDCRVEEYVDAEVLMKNVWNVFFKKNGDVFRCELSNSSCDYREIGKVTDTIYKRDYDLIINVEADDEPSAIKIAAEKRAKYLAEKNGL